MAYANQIIASEDLKLPPVPNPGRAALFIGLWKAKMKGQDVSLDYRDYDNHWIVLERDHSSTIGEGDLPFSIVASETGAIEYQEGKVEVRDMLPDLCCLFRQPEILVCDPVPGFSPETHQALCRVASNLPQPFSLKMLVDRLALEAPTDAYCAISRAHVKNWLPAMVTAGHLRRDGPDRRPRYRVRSRPSNG
jgi:hypothetical protein